MSATHLNLEILERFAASDLDPEAMIEAGRHLSACAPCRSRLRGEVAGGVAVLERLARKGWPEEEPTDYEGVFERLQAKALERIQKVEAERQLAPQLAAELASRPFAEQRQRIARDRRFHSAALVDLLLEQCAVLNREEPVQAEETARLALERRRSDLAGREEPRPRERPPGSGLGLYRQHPPDPLRFQGRRGRHGESRVPFRTG